MSIESDEDQLRATIAKDLRSQLSSMRSQEEQRQRSQGATKERTESFELKAAAGNEAFDLFSGGSQNDDYLVGKEAGISVVFARITGEAAPRTIAPYETFEATGRDLSVLFSLLLSEDFREPLAVMDGKAGSGVKLLRLAESLGKRLETVVGREDQPEVADLAHFNFALNRPVLQGFRGGFESSIG